jgi:hypothetical protein
VHQVRQFLGLTSYYRKFIRHYSHMALPLTELTKERAPWQWRPAVEQRAFDALKQALSSAPALVMADPNRPYQVFADASGFALGGVLLQDHGSGPQPVAYISKKLSDTEARYPTGDREMLAIVHALQQWRCYLEGAQFTICSGRKARRTPLTLCHGGLTLLPCPQYTTQHFWIACALLMRKTHITCTSPSTLYAAKAFGTCGIGLQSQRTSPYVCRFCGSVMIVPVLVILVLPKPWSVLQAAFGGHTCLVWCTTMLFLVLHVSSTSRALKFQLACCIRCLSPRKSLNASLWT